MYAMYCRPTTVSTKSLSMNRKVKQCRKTFIPTCIKITFDFNEDDEKRHQQKNYNKFNKFNMQNDNDMIPSTNRGVIEDLNSLFYRHTKVVTGDDIIKWVRQKWGTTLDMDLVNDNGQMNLAIFSRKADGPTYKNNVDKIANKISDWMLADFLHAEIQTHSASYRKTLWNNNVAKVFVTIPLGIYFKKDTN